MKKFLKTLLFCLLLFIIFTLTDKVHANSISKISMDIYIDNKGTATVTEIWNCNVSEGTEVYHPYYNLGNSKIENLTVSEGNTKYETLSSWNTSENFSSKSYKCGINRISDGVELCWGISKYGSHIYTIKYDITNFVSELSDSQMIYWTLIPYDFSNPIGNVYIKIYTDFNIPDSVDVWGYGNTGTAYVYNGYIEMQSDGRLPKDDYMTVLVKFPLDTFKTENKLNQPFNEYYEIAEEGAIHQEDETSISEVILIMICMCFPFLIIIIVVIAITASQTKYDLGLNGKNIPKNIPYYRDIPCQSNLFKSYYIAYQYSIIKNKTDILGAIILKWLKDDLIKIEQKETGAIFKKENTNIILNETNQLFITDKYESTLFSMLSIASQDGILESKEFEKWCSKNYTKILSWFDNIIKNEQNRLITEGSIILERQKSLKIFTRKVYKFSPEIKQQALNLVGLKRFLLDYSLIKEKEALQVYLLEEYLIYAQMLGIAKKVAGQFKDLYPEIIEQSHYTSYDNILFIHMCASSGISHANSAKLRAENYSSGGGGFSASGGGGGSFGGGGGRWRFPLITLMWIGSFDICF